MAHPIPPFCIRVCRAEWQRFTTAAIGLIAFSGGMAGCTVVSSASSYLSQVSLIPTIAQSSDPVVQTLVGQWQPTGSHPDLPALVFTQDGKFYLLAASGGKKQALELHYSIDADVQPMYLDLVLPGEKEPVQTILEFTADGQLRIETSLMPGKPRPTAFSDGAAVFKKVSDQASLPNNIEVMKLPQQP